MADRLPTLGARKVQGASIYIDIDVKVHGIAVAIDQNSIAVIAVRFLESCWDRKRRLRHVARITASWLGWKCPERV
jgi:hypothetical protein